MMMMYPGMYYPVYGGMMSDQMYGKSYGIFIRKAVESDEEEPEGPVKKEV